MSPSRSTTRNRISLASGAGGRRSPAGFVGTLLIHAAVIAAAFVTWQHRLDITQESPPIVPVDLVTIGQKTNIEPAAPKIAPQEPVPQVQPDKLVVQPPVVPEAEPPPPEQAPSEPAIKAPPPPIVPKQRPQAQDNKNSFNLESVQALLNKVAPQPSAQAPNAKTAAQARKGIGQQNAMTMDLVDALRNQIEQCWSPPAGAPHPEKLIVYVDLALNPDGSVAGAPQLDAQSVAAESGNPFMRAAADAAIRAIYVCAPYKLPANRYADWRTSTVRFDPRDLVGQ